MSFFRGTTAQSRDYQERICRKAMDMIEGKWVGKDGRQPGPARSVLIEAPTGSGKTVMALALAQHAHSIGKRVGWAAMRRHLLRQALDMRDKFGFHVPNMKVISMFDSAPPTDVDWLFVDEAQHDSTDSMAHIHSVVRPERVIGLSATPYRSDRAQLAFERSIRDVGIHALIQQGFLSEYDHYTIPSYTPESIAELFAKYPNKWGQSAVFFRTMDECEKMKALFNRLRIRNELVWRGSDKDDQIEQFRAAEIQVVISMSILAEGFDAEDMRTVFIRPSSKLPAVQMGGRVLRKSKIESFKQIVQCQDTHHPFVKTARARQSYVLMHDGFRSLKPNDGLEKIAHQMAKKILQITPSMPEFISKQKAAAQRGGDAFLVRPEDRRSPRRRRRRDV